MLAVAVQARRLVLLVLVDGAQGRGVDQHGGKRQVAGSLGRGDHEGVGAVDRYVHVEQAQGPADHAGGQVVVHRHRLAEGGGRVAGRVRAVVDGDVAEVLPGNAELVDVARGPGGVAHGGGHGLRAGRRRWWAQRAAPAERVLQRRQRVPGQPVGRVVGEHDVAQPAVDGTRRRRHLVDEGDHRVGEPGHFGDAEHRLHGGRIRERAADAVDVGGGEPAGPQHCRARLGGQRRLAATRVAGHEPRGGGAGEGHLVLHRVPVADHERSHLQSTRRNTGSGVPDRSIQSRTTRSPMAMASLGEPTTVLVKRRPGCSSSSTVTTGYGVV